MTYDKWKTTEPDDGHMPETGETELELLYARHARLRESHGRLLAAAKGLLKFNEELCEDINVSKHYPSAEKARAAIAAADGLNP